MFPLTFKNEKTIAIISASLLHIFLVLCLMLNKKDSKFELPQSLQVSLVAPSSHARSSSQNNPTQNIDILHKTGFKASQDNVISEKHDEKDSTNLETSGKEDMNAKALNSVITEPIFNAAYLNNPAPIYPASAKRDGVQGKVLLLVEVSESGFAKSVNISSTSGYSSLDNAARNAVNAWKFVPAMKHGKPVVARVLIPIEFKLS